VVDAHIKRWTDRLEAHRKKKELSSSDKLQQTLAQTRHEAADANIMSVHPADETAIEGDFTDDGDEKQAAGTRPNTTSGYDNSNHLGDLNRGSPSKRPGKSYSTPGPKYNLRVSSDSNRLLQKYIYVDHSNDSTARDIRFGTPGSRFPNHERGT
jgi:Tfp pilus assembly protein FimT